MNKKISQIILIVAVSSMSLLGACNSPNNNAGSNSRPQQEPSSSLGSGNQQPITTNNPSQNKRLVQNTAVAWQQFESIMHDFGQQSSQLQEPQEVSKVLKSGASELNSIVITNVDPEVHTIVSESQTLFINTYQTIDNYIDGINALNTQIGYDAFQECINAISNSQSDDIWYRTGECAGAGLVGGTKSTIMNSDERARLEQTTKRQGEIITSQFEELRTRASNVAQYLSHNYEIESQLF